MITETTTRRMANAAGSVLLREDGTFGVVLGLPKINASATRAQVEQFLCAACAEVGLLRAVLAATAPPAPKVGAACKRGDVTRCGSGLWIYDGTGHARRLDFPTQPWTLVAT